MNNYKIRVGSLIGPGLAWAAGLLLIAIFAPKTVYMNGMVMLGFLVLCIATFWALYTLYREYDKTGKEWPDFLDLFFPNYPVVEDRNKLMRNLSGFRRSYSDFLSSGHEEQNSSLQNYATQLMWHSTALQKKRLMKKGLTLEMDSVRRAYSGKGCGAPISLMEGKTCRFCGSNLDLKKHDWVIERYGSSKNFYCWLDGESPGIDEDCEM